MTSKLANHITLFCSHDNTGYLMKYIDPVLVLDQNYFSPWTGPKLIHLTLSRDLFVWDVISNQPIQTGLDFKSTRSDPVLAASPRTWSNCADLKSSPVFIVGFEILHLKSLIIIPSYYFILLTWEYWIHGEVYWSSPRIGSKLIHLTLSSDLFVWDVISNPSIRTGLDFKCSHFDPVHDFAFDYILYYFSPRLEI
jgi:hypothetical protein